MSGRRREDDDDDEEDASDAGSDSVASSGSGSDSEPEPRGKKRARGSAGGRRSAPQKKRPGTIFVDDQADVSTDEEGDDSDEGDVGDLIAPDEDEPESTAGAAAAAARLHARSGGRFRSDLPDESAELQRIVDTRYGHASQMNYGDDGAMAEGAVGQASLQPTIRDPKLYRVSCLAGREKEGVICLMQKHFAMAAKGTPLAISGAVAPEHLKASIYVEARRADAVRTAVAGLRVLSAYNMTAVPLDEMVAVMALPKRAQKLRPYAWVRITRGMYKDDLAQVFDVREGGGELSVVIRLVPRLDLSVPGEESDEDEQEDEATADRRSRFGNKAGGRRFGLTASGDRPPQRLFDKDELRRTHGSSVDVYTKWDRNSQEEYDWWEKKQFCYGLLYKKVAPKSLLSGDAVHPTVEEVEIFQAAEARMRSTARENDEEEVEQKSLHLDLTSVAAARVTVLLKGDAIRIISGEQKGAVGTVSGVQEKDGVVSVKLKGIPDPVPVSRSSVVKHFSAGDHVKVAVGRRSGETGVVVDVVNEVLTLFSDATKEEFKVLASSVVESSDLAAELVIAGPGGGAGGDVAPAYELFDLVSLHSDPRARGVVVQVKADGVTILDLHGRVRAVSLRDVKGKVADRHVRSLDMRKNPVAANDVIRVADGPLKNRTGIVKHVSGDTVFFQARDEMRNCGMLVVAASRVLAQSVGSSARRAPLSGGLGMNGVVPRTPTSSLVRAASPFHGPLSAMADGRNSRPEVGIAPSARSSIATMSGGMRGMGGGGRGRGRGAGDPLDSKYVTIKSGSYKGYKGRVMSANDSRVRIELDSMMKVVTIERHRVVEREGVVRVGRGYASGRVEASTGHGRPPAHAGGDGYGGMPARGSTPGRMDNGYGGNGGYAVGSRTPSHGGMGMSNGYGQGPRPFTPSRGATPGRFGDGSRTPAHPGMGGSGFLGSATPAHPSSYGGIGSATPAHPSFGAESYRPMTPSSRPGAASPYNQAQPAPSSAPYNPYGVASGSSAYPSDVPTPGGMPRTPGTPMVEPRTPGGGGMLAEPRTPAVDGGYGTEAGTPYEAVATPGTYGDVPATPGDGFAGEQESGTAEFDALVDVEVTVVLGKDTDASSQRPARVVSVRPDGAMYTVAWLDGADAGTEAEIGYQDLMIVSAQCEPEGEGQAGERVKVIRGDHLGKRAAVVSADEGGETVLRLEDNQDIIVVSKLNLAKLAVY
ncbi:hypothetical protein I4F81_011602 [Pyropia yezoensis]|uniref:Uncharacterized protein n=1 Tax=Pyropia yezoensis TaxID=2788 RepID=A0ACC3CGQ8_PYRYE|nr:hypothetical protein I4F81_011602 [Neopyropia yezoensis]